MTEPRRCSCWLPWAHQIGCELRPVRREQERTPPPEPRIPERGEWDAVVRAAEHRAIEVVEATEPPLRAERLVAQIHRLAGADRLADTPPMLGWDPAEQ